jgi:hypothetical protein
MVAPKGHKPYAGSETGGRPPKFTDSDIDKFADELMIWIKNEENYWLKDFCLEKGMHSNYMAEWAKSNQKFGCAYNTCKEIQESRMFKGAMVEKFNAGMAKFALMNNHAWADKQESKISGDATNPLSFIYSAIDGKTKDLIDDKQE